MKKHVVFDCDGTLVDTSAYKVALFAGIKDFLGVLSLECQLYVWTARSRASTLRILQELGVYHYFEAICTIDDAPPKPHIGGLIDLVGKESKDGLFVIGDSSYDMMGAKNFGATALGAMWNSESKADVLKNFGADFIVSHPSECSKIILQNSSGE
jgi:phosphoglycolate phosphatase-like HAD superfamily hydrolase